MIDEPTDLLKNDYEIVKCITPVREEEIPICKSLTITKYRLKTNSYQGRGKGIQEGDQCVQRVERGHSLLSQSDGR